MKKLLAIVLFSFLSLNFAAYASTINLNSGDSITIMANTTTTVTCGGDGGGNLCQVPVKNLKNNFDYCKTTLGATVEGCINDIWPTFKEENRRCVADAYDTCMTFCKTSFPRLNCLETCQ